MPRNEFGRIPAGRSTRFDLTRRGLLGVAAVITGAGIADLVHKSGHNSSPTRLAGNTSAVTRKPVVTVNEPRVLLSTPSQRATAPATPSHAPEHDNSTPVSHSSAHGRGRALEHDRLEDHVQLPPAQLRVRKRPIFYIDDLIHNAPKHAIALTVDDGPNSYYTPKVLRLLDKYHMQASFCIVGARAEEFPWLIRDIHRAGHAIVNHSFTHVMPFNKQTEKRIVNEITRCQRAIEKAAKVTPQLFRAPGGAWSPFIFRAVAAYDLIPLDWDVDPMDWALPGTRKIERAMLKGRPNDIVLCHDGGGNRSETVRALRTVLPDWKHRGYVTIPLVPPAKHKHKSSHSTTPTPNPSTSTSPTTSPSDSATP
jgi:peptidoglycan/xylan/chitin deacetylase (PgdA/CDA1 family)